MEKTAMAKKDLISKKLEDYNDVFADIYNTLLFQSPTIIPEQLEAAPTESIYKTDTQDLNLQNRDILKKYQNNAHLAISFLGIENQASIDKYMPIRIMGYDAGTYKQQLKDKTRPIIPAITIVLNMADQKWNAAKSLHELLSIDKQLADYVQDYKIHVFDIAFLDDKIINSFTSDFKEVAKFFKKKRLGLNPLDSYNKLSHPREIMEFISVFTQDTRYSDSVQYLENLEEKGGVATMCAVADALISEGIRKGRLEGKLEGKIELLYELDYSIAEICQKLDVPEGQVKNVLHL
ncbi:hypothetical protein D7V86_08535 [bacterium D16-51]|nr:hypothetical protein D7V96_08520 [bacterium D16-59]RKI60636.1 hypothetical protein D7V86_08535 [bacterium D16-51]